MQLTVVCSSNEDYAMPLAACLASACYFLGADASLRVFVLDADLEPATRAKLERSIVTPQNAARVSLTFVPVPRDAAIRRSPGRMHLNWVALTKLLIPDLLPQVDKAIWIDSDMVVCADLVDLWNVDMRDHALLAVKESTVGRTVPFAPDYGVPLDTPYFNSGLMVMDLVALRRVDFTVRALRFLQDHLGQLPYLDQDVFNVVGAGTWLPLDPLWNFVVGAEPHSLELVTRARARPHPYIVHYASYPKPWHWFYGLDRPHQAYFYHALALTEWRGWMPPDRAERFIQTRLPALYGPLKRLEAFVRRSR